MKREVGVINTDRSRNCAYVYWLQEYPYWCTNIEIRLDWIEEYMGCKFSDGRHPFVSVECDINLLEI